MKGFVVNEPTWIRTREDTLAGATMWGDPLGEYAHYPELRIDAPTLLERVSDQLCAAHGLVVCADDSVGNCAFVAAHPSPFDTACLDVSIARLSQLVAWGPDPTQILAKTLDGALDGLSVRGIEVVLAQPLVQETQIQQALGQGGFTVGSRKLSYYCPRNNRDRVKPARSPYRVRRYRPSDLNDLVELGQRFEFSQFLEIPQIDPSRVPGFYRAWIRNACAGQFADGVLVSETPDGRPCGLFSYKVRDDVRFATGLNILGHGLTAIDRRSPGAFLALVLEFQRMVSTGEADGVEFQFYEASTAVQRMFERFLCHHALSAQVYHRTL